MTENQILEMAKAIIAQQGERKTWGVREHCALISFVARKHVLPALDKDGKDDPKKPLELKVKAFQAALGIKGLGGNASAFRQWLEGLLILPKAAKQIESEYAEVP